MKKRLTVLLLTLALLLSCCGVFASADTSYRQEDIEQELMQLMEQYCGTHWYGSFGGAIQCKGFADMVFDDLFGTGAPGPYSSSRYDLPYATSRGCTCIGILSRAECNEENVHDLLCQALPGDYVQCVRSSGTQHSMIVVETTDKGITFFDCNLKGNYLCACYTYSWEEAGRNLTRGLSLYRHNGYEPTNQFRLYFDPNGGECELESKVISVGSQYGPLPTPERKGYVFEGWYVREFNSTTTSAQYPVTSESTKTAYANAYLVAHWRVDEGPCANFGHMWEYNQTVAPTCTLDGYDEEVCTVCKKTRSTNLEAPLGHDFVLLGTVPATNVDDGSETFECTRCSALQTTTLVCRLNLFTDLNPNSWYYSYVRTMVSNGLMNGISDTSFAPNANLTRAMLVTILYRMQGQPEAAAPDFRDVPAGAWYEDAVGWASECGLVDGYPDGSFRPNVPITREQVATILFRCCAIMGRSNTSRTSLSTFGDTRAISGYAVEPMEWAAACGVLSGFPDSTLRPRGNAARAQIAKMIVTLTETVQPEEGVF